MTRWIELWSRALAVFVVAIVVAAPALAQEASEDEASDMSGSIATLSGQVVIGPTCPVVRVDRLDQCQDRPYAATLSIRTPDGLSEVSEVTTDDQGNFSVQLDAGTYLVVPLTPPGSILPRGMPQTVTLAPGELSNVLVQYDSGLR